ncbi:MAG: HlyC/CorC family transporter [Anaerolineae bacterium]|nr:HlyC/CorC family transporter [Anaerolineae bacterium]
MVAWLCSAVRAAIMTVEHSRADAAAEQGDERAMRLVELLENPYRSLAPVTFLFTVALIGLALALTWNAFETHQALYPRLSEIAFVLSVFIAGKVVFDYIATARSFAVSLMLAHPLSWVDALASPFLNLNDWLTRLAKGPRARKTSSDRVSADDIQIIMAEGEEPRKIELMDPDEREMIAGIIEMGQRYASEIMVPRLDVVALDVDSTIDNALDVAIKHGHSRLPVHEADIDHMVGILHVKDLLQAMRHPHQDVALRDLLRPVHYVPETVRADDILRDLLRNRIHMAVVVDEYGGTSGILTIEDLLEEIVGEIRDEYDTAEKEPYTRISDTEANFEGSVSINEFNDAFGTELPTEGSDTLGGLIYTQLGRLPRVGDRVRIGNVELMVTAMNGRRIKLVRALKLPQEPQIAAKSNEENYP